MTRRAPSAESHRRLHSSRRSPRRAGSRRVLADDPKRLASASSALEAAVVIRARKGPPGIRELDLLIHSWGATIVSFDAGQVLLARSAYEKYGTGHHPAVLNLGNCCS